MSSKRIAVVFIVLLCVGVIIGIFSWLKSNNARGLDVALEAPPEIKVGAPFDLRAKISNTSSSVLEQSRLTIVLPETMAFLGKPPSEKTTYSDLGALGVGSLREETFRVMVIHGENMLHRVTGAMSYSPEAIGSRFEKTTDLDIPAGQFALVLDLDPPEKVLNNESFNVVVSYRNNSSFDFSNLHLRLQYPPTFTLTKTTLPADRENREWDLGDLRAGSEGKFTISGSVVGPDDASLEFRGVIEVEFSNVAYEVTSSVAQLTILPSPLALSVTVNDLPEYIASPGDSLHYVLRYQNRSDTGLQDVIVRAKLTGDMLDFSRLGTRAAFRSSDATLMWNVANTPELALIPPGGSGSVDFTIGAEPDYVIRRLGDRNFLLKVSGEIESSTVPPLLQASKTLGLGGLEIKVRGRAAIDAQAYFRDAAAGVINTGPWPPRVDQSTQYTIHWVVKSFATDMNNVEIRSFLGGNTKFVKIVRSTEGSVPVYNDRTQEIVWTIPKIPANKGVIDKPVEAVFQIEGTPPSSVVGSPLSLLQETHLRATDDFTGAEVEATDEALSTDLRDDTTVKFGEGDIRQ